MIYIGMHFESGRETVLYSPPEFSSSCAVLTVRQGDMWVEIFFPAAAARDAVRDALLQCPGCVARAEETATPEVPGPPLSVIVTGGGSHAPTTTMVITPQPAVQAMEGQEEDWF